MQGFGFRVSGQSTIGIILVKALRSVGGFRFAREGLGFRV